MLYNRSLLGWLLIVSLLALLKLNFFLLDLNNNSLTYRTAVSLQATTIANLVLFLTNTLPSQTKSLHFLNFATITYVTFTVSAHTLTSKQPSPLQPPSFILNLTTVTLSIITFQTVNLTGFNRFKTLLLVLLLRLLNPHISPHSQISPLAKGQWTQRI